MWQLLILLSVLLGSFATVLQRIILKSEKSDPVAVSLFFLLVIGTMMGVLGIILKQQFLPANIVDLLPNLLLMALLYGLGNLFVFHALKHIDASIFTVLYSGRALITVVASTLFLQESLNVNQWYGALLVFGAILLVTRHAGKTSVSKGQIYAIFAAVAYGLETTNDRILLQYFDLYPYLSLAFLAPGLVTAVAYPRSVGALYSLVASKTLYRMMFLCCAYGGAAIFFFLALQLSGNSSQVAAINVTGVIVTALLAIIILKETQNTWKKLTAAILACIGLVLLR